MCQNDLIPFQHIYEESKNIYKLLFTLNGAAIVSLVTLIVSYDKNDVLKGFEILSRISISRGRRPPKTCAARSRSIWRRPPS